MLPAQIEGRWNKSSKEHGFELIITVGVGWESEQRNNFSLDACNGNGNDRSQALLSNVISRSPASQGQSHKIQVWAESDNNSNNNKTKAKHKQQQNTHKSENIMFESGSFKHMRGMTHMDQEDERNRRFLIPEIIKH